MSNCGQHLTEHWSTVIGVAMHFNGMLISTRSLVASVMTAVVGAAAVSAIHPKTEDSRIGGVPIGVFILLGGLVFLACMFVLDHFYYYRLLLGSVDIAEGLEHACPSLPKLTIELSQRVSRDWAFCVSVIFYGAIGIAMLAMGGWICWWGHKKKGRP